MNATPACRRARTIIVAGCLFATSARGDDEAPPPASALAGPRGFGLDSGDGFRLHVRTFASADVRAFAGERPAGASERTTFAVRAAGVQVDAAAHGWLQVQLLANFADRASMLTTATIEVDAAAWLRVRVGRFAFPLTQERLTPPLSLPFVGTSVVGLAIPPFDTGAHVRGELADARLAYDLALVNGAVAGGSGDADLDGGKDLVARVFARPFRGGGLRALEHLGIGVGASWGPHRGRLAAPGTPVLRTYGGQPWFAYRNDTTSAGTSVADGTVARLAPHLVWALGPVALQADALVVRERIAGTDVELRAWDVIPTVALTGEDAAPLAFVIPRHPLGGPRGGIGAVILVAGFGQLAIDDAAFASAADPATSAAAMSVIGGGIKWYPVAGLAVFVDYGHMWFRTAPGGVRRPAEDTLIARVQVIL